MSTTILPFKINDKIDGILNEDLQNNILKALPENLQKAAQENPHLFEYLKNLTIAKISIPEYYDELSHKMAEKKDLNLIYPVGRYGVFVHILSDQSGDRNYYIPIEPSTTLNLDQKISEVDDACIEISYNFTGIDPNQDKEKKLLEYVDQVTTQNVPINMPSSNKYLHLLHKQKDKISKVRVGANESEAIKYLFLRDKIGLGVLQPLIIDPYIEDISCSGMGNVFVEHKIFQSLKSTINFSTFEDLDDFTIRLAERVKKPVTYK
ncbi:MAG: hypothetical protein ABR924_19250, partial [Terracidiphilus sp.]